MFGLLPFYKNFLLASPDIPGPTPPGQADFFEETVFF